MIKKSNFRLLWWYPLAAVALLAMLSLSATGASAGGPKLGNAQAPDTSGTIGALQTGPLQGGEPSKNAPRVQNALVTLVPDTTTLGTCPAPANGGTTQVGCTFVLDLMLNSGTNPDATAQQSYLTFTYQTIQNARVSSIGTSCVPTSTVTPDLNTFDAVLQNEVCN